MPKVLPETPRVCIVSPALAAANNGNWQTASRWHRFLAPVYATEVREAWHPAGGETDGSPSGSTSDDDQGSNAPVDCDVLIALHARRSADSIERFHRRWPDRPIALLLTGTDLYGNLETDVVARHSLKCASVIVVLQERGIDGLDAESASRARVIVQSAPTLLMKRLPIDPDFAAVGHLRSEKDPQTLWAATRLLATDDRPPRIVHVGAALDAAFGTAARATMASCPAYRWVGPLPHARSRRAMASARALVHPSRVEGGANVVIEAVRSRVPVLASRIDGNVGLLGAGYDGYFQVGDAAALAALMRGFLHDADFAAHLSAQCALREPLFDPEVERSAVRTLVADLVAALPRSR